MPVATVMAGEKTTTQTVARCLPGLPFAVEGRIRGYEIHMGQTRPLDESRPVLGLEGQDHPADGQVSADGRVVGTYLHGLLDNDGLRAALLAWARGRGVAPASLLSGYRRFQDRQYDLLADFLEQHLCLDDLLEPLSPR